MLAQFAHFVRLIVTPVALASAGVAGQQSIATEVAKLIASDVQSSASFGFSVAVSGDTAVVGSIRTSPSGTAYVFERDQGGPGAWGEVAKLAATSGFDDFGWSVAISGDAIAVGAPRTGSSNVGAVYVFERNQGGAGAWGEVAVLTEVEDFFGTSVAISGASLVVGAPDDDFSTFGGYYVSEGAAYIYTRGNGAAGTWTMSAKLRGSDQEQYDNFGGAVGIAGDTVVVGADRDDHEVVVGGGANRGSAYVFERNQGGLGAWGEVKKLTAKGAASGDFFGYSLALHEGTLIVGAPYVGGDFGLPGYVGAAYVFERNLGGSGAWGESTKIAASDGDGYDFFGVSVGLWDGLAVVGASGGEGAGLIDTGAAYVFARNDGGPGAWGEVTQMTASDAATDDRFGFSTDISGNEVIIGAITDDHGVAVGDVHGLAFDRLTNTLFGTDVSNDRLLRINPVSGAGCPIGDLGFGDVAGLAFDSNSSTLFGSDVSSGQLVRIDTTSGLGTPVGPIGFSKVEGLAFDRNTNTLYGADDASDQLIIVDTTTGAGTPVGPIGFPRVWGLAFDPSTNILYGAKEGVAGVSSLITIDTATGSGVTIGPVGFDDARGLSFDSIADLLHGSELGTGQLLRIDSASGVGTPIGPLSTLTGPDAGSAYVFELSSVSVAYCTAGTSANGCQATISASGAASATVTSGFDLVASSAEGQKDGLFFFGSNGQQANSWGNGTSYQCVVPPVTRGGLLTGIGTTGLCDGSFSQDLNALWCPTCPKPQKNPGAGATVQAQLWYRDPQNTSNQTTSLSDAIEFTVAP